LRPEPNPRGIRPVTGIPFEDCMDEAEIFVCDFISTALAIATTKPVVYFDIGRRNPTPEAVQALKEGCVFVSTDPASPQALWERVASGLREQKTNSYSEPFSLSPQKNPGRKRVDVALEVLRELLH